MIGQSRGTGRQPGRQTSQTPSALRQVGHLTAEGASVPGRSVEQPQHGEHRETAADRLEVLPPRSGNIERAEAAEQTPAVIAHDDSYRAAVRALAWSRHDRSFPRTASSANGT